MNVRWNRSTVLWGGVALLLCGGTAFMAAFPHFRLAHLLCHMWAAFSVMVIGICFCMAVVLKRDYLSSTHAVLMSFFCVGILEIVCALLQLGGLFPVINPYYHFTGSFDNPAVFAMFMSFCLPIGMYFTARSTAVCRLVWGVLTFCMGAFLILSASRTGILAGICSAFIMWMPKLGVIKDYRFNRKRIILLWVALALLAGVLYWCKQDSADGRLLAWKVSANMIADRPFLGWGNNGFDAFYMPYQADYFMRNPESSFLLLADNLSHPFNEFLWFTVQYGIAGLILLLLMLGWILKNVFKGCDKQKKLWISLYFALAIWAMFSYPFHIPFVWLVIAYLLSVSLFPVFARFRFVRPLAFCALLVAFLYSVPMAVSYKNEVHWVKVQEKALMGETLDMLPQYAELYKDLKDDGAFLYNYGAELHFARHYNEALKILQECASKYNDYNVQMLMASCYQHLGQPQMSIEKYRYANRMVPNRFLPLYHEMRIYRENGDSVNACEVARTIMNKPVKIKKSAAVKRIIQEANECLDHYTERVMRR